ncbi:hypothetical protein GCM10009795_010310 [Nocardioides hankookensis]|uniref:Oxidoreductase n=1 Tax=Nocardioides hankookensis TaxID=443157 RepID=A0ABW1LIY7_9ACTN
MSLPRNLCHGTLDEIVERGGLTEVTGADGGPYLELVSSAFPGGQAPVGEARVFTGDSIAKVVYVGLAVPQIGLDSHMVFAFCPADVAVPHFTLDSVQGQGTYAFHLDLIPRADLGTHLPYLDWAHTPLDATYEEVESRPGLMKTAIGPRQFAMMSPWMLVHRAEDEAFRGISDAVKAYLDHWFSLVEAGVPAEVVADVADTDLAARDARNRTNVFSPDVDKVWAQVERLIGHEQTEAVRGLLLDNCPPEVSA